MSVTTKSMVLLAAMGLAACESSNSNTLTPEQPAEETPELVEPEIAVLTRANAVPDLFAGAGFAGVEHDGDLGTDDEPKLNLASDARAERVKFATATTKFETASALRVQMLAILGSAETSADLSKPDRDSLDELVDKFNISTGVDYNPEEGDAVADLNEYFAEGGIVALALFNATDAFDNAIAALNIRDNVTARRVSGKDIVLADGTVLATAGLAVYTRVDESAVASTVLTPTATVIVAYEADKDGNPINVRFVEAGGIGYEGAPVGTAFADFEGKSFAYLQVEGEDAMRFLNGTADMSLNFNQQTGSLSISASGDGFYESRSTLSFDRVTGAFTSTSGDFVVLKDNQAFVGNNVTAEGELQGLAEAFSGTFTITDSRVNGVGGFASIVAD